MSRAVVGMHFFNPAPVMKLVEVIAGDEHQAGDRSAEIKDISAEIGKTPVQVKEAAGFVVNRILIPMINEAVGIYAEGVASCRGHRYRHEAGRQPSDGPAVPGRSDRPGCMLGHHGSAGQARPATPKYRPASACSARWYAAASSDARPAKASIDYTK